MTEQKNCPYCHEDAEGYVTPLEKNGHAFIGRTLGTSDSARHEMHAEEIGRKGGH